MMADLHRTYPWLRSLTVTDAGDALRVREAARPRLEYGETELKGSCEAFYGEAYFYLRTEKTPLAVNDSCQIVPASTAGDALYSFALKRLAGFGKEGEKNFEGTVTDLQMGGYLLIRDFRRRLNKRGQPYGWPLAVYATPEALWGGAHITSAYSVDPAQSREQILQQVKQHFPAATEAALQAVLGREEKREGAR